MSRLLIVTDHRYFVSNNRIVDTYCFDRSFFDDYRAVFDEVVVAARVRSDVAPITARVADGDGVSFVHLPDLRGSAWPRTVWVRGLPYLRDAVASATAVCVRIPSTAAHAAYRYAISQKKPLMFEMIGHPVHSWRGHKIGPWALLFMTLDSWMTRRIVAHSVVGSYVSAEYLQRDYPPPAGTQTEVISSIRLREEDFRGPRSSTPTHPELRVVFVGSLVPVKDHRTLLKGVAAARASGADIRVDLVGDGPERDGVTKLSEKLGLTSVVKFHGHVSDRDQLARVLDECDLFVMTSLSEGMPRSMIEGMARGLPAVGTAVGGIRELLAAEQTFAPEDVPSLCQLLLRVNANRRLLTEWSVRAFNGAKQFEQGFLSQKRLRLLTELRDGPRGAAR